ncbi:hypothetical protein ZWY2020_006291 [Hordeum vulgare]|nr:hypothetical protein ZWY2020_006291 [Hordeum vulgare]
MALDGGPWEFGNDVLVLEDFVPRKRIEDYCFDTILIWVHVLRFLLGMMSIDTSETIGAEIGEVLDIDTHAKGGAVGRYLRVKVRMNIKVPLMRGFTLEEEGEDDNLIRSGMDTDEEEDRNYCPFEYEYLRDFCYKCGILGHVDKLCKVQLKKGEQRQFGPWLRACMDKRRGGAWSATGGRGQGSRNSGAWKGRSSPRSDAPS